MINRLRTMKLASPLARSTRLAMVMVGLFALGACASAPMAPTDSLQAAERAITTAEHARVADYASRELSRAREKLAAARVAVHDEKMGLARRLADEAFVDAELAIARAGEAKAKAVNMEMKRSTETLKQEMDRNTGESR